MIKVYQERKLNVRLYAINQTAHLWVLTFRDPVNLLVQSAIISKETPWEGMATIWEKIHKDWGEALKEKAWQDGTWKLS